jgi:hypothetical protein
VTKYSISTSTCYETKTNNYYKTEPAYVTKAAEASGSSSWYGRKW